MTYRTVLIYYKGRPRTLKKGLTLEQAQKICNDPETSSTTCTKYYLRKRTEERGPWFVGYESERD